MSMPADFSLDDIAARLHAEDTRLRRRTLWLTLLPIAVGIAVLATAWWGVHRANLETSTLDARIQEQQGAIADLKTQRAALDHEIAMRKDLLDHYAARLPEREREEVQQLQQGLAQAQRGDTSAAIQTFERAAANDVGNPLPYRLRGSALYALGDYAQAEASLRQALALDGQDAQARYFLALALWAQDRGDEALAQIDQAFVNPDIRARALQDPAYQPIRAVRDDRAAEKTARSDAEKRYIEEALQAARRGDFTAAVATYDKALADNPENARILNWRGYALFRAQTYGEAIESFDRAIAVAPDVPEIHYNRALALWKSGRHKEAMASLERAYQVDPTYRAVAERDPQSRELRAAASSGS